MCRIAEKHPEGVVSEAGSARPARLAPVTPRNNSLGAVLLFLFVTQDDRNPEQEKGTSQQEPGNQFEDGSARTLAPGDEARIIFILWHTRAGLWDGVDPYSGDH